MGSEMCIRDRSPEEGFAEGRYSLEVWVNGELLGQASATMNDAAVSAGN